jgi:hypothetical protein
MSTRDETLQLECVNRKRENDGCPYKIYFVYDVYTQTGLHNHEPMFDEQNWAAVVHECVTIAETPGQGRQGQKRISEQSRREKRSTQPPTPNSVEDIVQSIETPPEFKYGKNSFLVSTSF